MYGSDLGTRPSDPLGRDDCSPRLDSWCNVVNHTRDGEMMVQGDAHLGLPITYLLPFADLGIAVSIYREND